MDSTQRWARDNGGQSEAGVALLASGERPPAAASWPEGGGSPMAATVDWIDASGHLRERGPSAAPNLTVALEDLSRLANSRRAIEKPSIAKRTVRTLGQVFFIAVMIGVGATIVWQYHGHPAGEMVSHWLRPLSALLFDSPTKPLAAVDPAAQATAAGQTSVHDAPGLPVVETDPARAGAQTEPNAPVAATSALRQRLESLAGDLAVLKRSVEQLAATQEQMARNITALQATERNSKPKISTPPPPRAMPIPPRQPTPRVAPLQPATPLSSAPVSSSAPDESGTTIIPRPPGSLRAQ
jgi:hypothetical protein